VADSAGEADRRADMDEHRPDDQMLEAIDLGWGIPVVPASTAVELQRELPPPWSSTPPTRPGSMTPT
jgi:hypothetical protein